MNTKVAHGLNMRHNCGPQALSSDGENASGSAALRGWKAKRDSHEHPVAALALIVVCRRASLPAFRQCP
jgi:hypothetical protein